MPATSGKIISVVAMSNERVVMASHTSPGPSPKSRPIASRTLRCDALRMMTPLGRPVDPEV